MNKTAKTINREKGKTNKILKGVIVLLATAIQAINILVTHGNEMDNSTMIGAIVGRTACILLIIFGLNALISKVTKDKKKNISLIVITILVLFASMGNILSTVQERIDDTQHYEALENLVNDMNKNFESGTNIKKEVISEKNMAGTKT